MSEFESVPHEIEVFANAALARRTYKKWDAQAAAAGDEITYDGKFLTVFRMQRTEPEDLLRRVQLHHHQCLLSELAGGVRLEVPLDVELGFDELQRELSRR